MVKIIWTHRAVSQLERAIKYIKEERGVPYASIVLNRIIKSTSLLSNQPQLGPIEPLLKHKKTEYRYLVAFAYKVIYKVKEDKIVIVRVFHSDRSPEKLKGV